MKVYLDDERPTPEGWIRVHWPEEAIDLINAHNVTDISLDHDLGDDVRGTGYDVLLWIEEQAFTDPDFICPNIHIHTANPSAREKMEAARRSIYEKLYGSL